MFINFLYKLGRTILFGQHARGMDEMKLWRTRYNRLYSFSQSNRAECNRKEGISGPQPHTTWAASRTRDLASGSALSWPPDSLDKPANLWAFCSSSYKKWDRSCPDHFPGLMDNQTHGTCENISESSKSMFTIVKKGSLVSRKKARVSRNAQQTWVQILTFWYSYLLFTHFAYSKKLFKVASILTTVACGCRASVDSSLKGGSTWRKPRVESRLTHCSCEGKWADTQSSIWCVVWTQ